MQITITYGGESQIWTVHKNVLESQSDYFTRLSGFKEGSENKVNFDGIDFSAFENIVTWMYQSKLHPAFNKDRVVLIHTWVAADRLTMTRCKNEVMDALRQACADDFTMPEYLAIVEELGYTEDSLLAEFLTDNIAHDGMLVDLSENGEEYTKALESMPIKSFAKAHTKLMERAQYHRKKKPGDPDTTAEKSLKECHYHEHKADEKCYLKGEV